MTFDSSRISKTNLKTSVEHLQRHILNHLLFWALRYPAHCTGLERLRKLSQNKICYRLHAKYLSFSSFPITCLSAVWKSKSFLISWWKLTKCYSKLLPTNSATCRLFPCIFYKSISIDVSKKVYVILCNLWTRSKNVASSRSHVKLPYASLRVVCFG